jgi:two-component system, sensor histidine kinase RegB
MSAADPIRPSGAPNLQRLLWVRAILAALLALGAWLAPLTLGLQFARAPLVWVLGAVLALSAFAWWRIRSGARISEPEIFAHLCADTAALALTMYYTGGYMNPLISLMLLPLVSAATVLPARYAWVLALATVAAYTLLMEHYEPLSLSGEGASMFRVHLAGMWVTFVLSALLVAIFIARMSASVRARDRALAQAREQMLRQQQVAALGALAAGAAHELGTPLATMAVIVRELSLDANAANAPDLHALAQQIEACKRIIARLQSRAGATHTAHEAQPPSGAAPILLDEYLREIVEHWRLIRPSGECRLELRGDTPAPKISADAALAQAIVNLLNNAAEVLRCAAQRA